MVIIASIVSDRLFCIQFASSFCFSSEYERCIKLSSIKIIININYEHRNETNFHWIHYLWKYFHQKWKQRPKTRLFHYRWLLFATASFLVSASVLYLFVFRRSSSRTDGWGWGLEVNNLVQTLLGVDFVYFLRCDIKFLTFFSPLKA